MIIQRRYCFSLVIFAFLCACAPVTINQFLAEGKKPLTDKQLHELIANQGLHLESIDLDARIHYLANGLLTATSLQGQGDKGKWTITSKDRFCMKFDRWYYGDFRCYQVFSENSSYVFFTTNGARYYTATTFPISVFPQTDQTISSDISSPSQTRSSPPVSLRTVVDQTRSLASLARNCPDCNFSGIDLNGAQLITANLTGSDFSGANLSGANLRRANLTGANLSGANLKRSNLAGANLTNCDLRGADLTGSNLIRANLTGAQLDGAVLTGAHLEGIQGLNK